MFPPGWMSVCDERKDGTRFFFEEKSPKIKNIWKTTNSSSWPANDRGEIASATWWWGTNEQFVLSLGASALRVCLFLSFILIQTEKIFRIIITMIIRNGHRRRFPFSSSPLVFLFFPHVDKTPEWVERGKWISITLSLSLKSTFFNVGTTHTSLSEIQQIVLSYQERVCHVN